MAYPWLDSVIQALRNLGGEAHLSEIYPEVKQIRISNGVGWGTAGEASTRKILEKFSSDTETWDPNRQDLFQNRRLGEGVWSLRNISEDYREGFINYLTEIVKVGESSINAYINSLETASRILISRGLSKSEIFSISSSNKAKILLESYLSQADLNESNNNSHRRVSAAWNHLIKYLSTKNIKVTETGNVKVKRIERVNNRIDEVKELEYEKETDGSFKLIYCRSKTEPELVLQKSFEEILIKKGLGPYSREFEVMGTRTSKNKTVLTKLTNDIFLDGVNFLIEAKIYTRENVRMVIGQIKDYARYCEPYPNCATLLSEKPNSDLIDLLLKEDIYCIWKNPSNNSFEDNIPEGMLFS